MNNDRSTTRQSFLSRVFAGTTEGEGTSIYSAEEVGTGRSQMGEQEGAAHGFTVERAAEVIKNLPPEVPRLSAVRIVRGRWRRLALTLPSWNLPPGPGSRG